MSDEAVSLPRDMYERFKAYPSCVERLQRSIDLAVADPSGIPVFEQITYGLEDTLTAFVMDARDQLRTAQRAGDATRIAQAQELVQFMLHSAWIWSYDLSELQDQFPARPSPTT